MQKVLFLYRKMCWTEWEDSFCVVQTQAEYTDLEIQFRSSYYTVVAGIRKISNKSFSLEVVAKMEGTIWEI